MIVLILVCNSVYGELVMQKCGAKTYFLFDRFCLVHTGIECIIYKHFANIQYFFRSLESLRLPVAIGRRPSSSGVRRSSCINSLTFLTSYILQGRLLPFFMLSISIVKEIKIGNSMALSPSGCHRRGQIYKNAIGQGFRP